MAEDDEEAMRKAFEQFMVTTPKEASTPVATSSSPRIAKQLTALKKMERKYWQIINAFQGTLERDWLQVDDNLEAVMSSIAELRRRIFMESRQLCKDKNPKEWQGFGYRASSTVGLSAEDVELALSHDLLQHEKLQSGARMLLSSLSQAQEALGRRLEEIMLLHLETLETVEHGAIPNSLWTVMGAVDRLQDVFTSLAMELYRKQVLVQSVLDAVNNDMLADEDAQNDVNPRKIADACARDFPRNSTKSNVHTKTLDGLLKLGRQS